MAKKKEQPAAVRPPPLREHDCKNFETLKRAYREGGAALMSLIRKSDQKAVAAICAMSTNDDGTITPVPFAVMVEGNPFELFEDPTVEHAPSQP